MLRNIAEHAGAYVLGGAGHETHMSGRLISLHARGTGPVRLTLPDGSERVVDVKAQETYWVPVR